MPVDKYKSVNDMPRPPRVSGTRLSEAMNSAWEMAHVRHKPNPPRGVTKFRSIEDAQERRRAVPFAEGPVRNNL